MLCGVLILFVIINICLYLKKRLALIIRRIKILSILAENIYINKFLPEVGIAIVEKKIIDKKDTEITDDHLIVYRIFYIIGYIPKKSYY